VAHRGGVPLWIALTEEAELYRRLARLERDPLKSSLLRLAARILEDLSDDFYGGYLRRSTLDKLDEVLRLLRAHGLPYARLEKYRRLALRMLRPLDDAVALKEWWASAPASIIGI